MSHTSSAPAAGRWPAFLGVFAAAVFCAVNQFKVVPVLADVQELFGVSLSAAGWVSSIYALSILVLAVPGALVVRRLGARNAALLALGVSCAASLASAFCGHMALFIVLRVFEGVGQALLFVIGPTLIAELFEEHERGLPLGIFNSAVPIAVVIAYNLAAPIRDAMGLGAIWCSSAVLLAVAFVLVWATAPKAADAADSASNGGKTAWSAWANIGIVLCCLTFCGSGFRDLAYSTWAPSYYAQDLGLSETAANFGTSMEYVGLVVGSIAMGYAADRMKRARSLAVTLAVVELLTCAMSVVGFTLFAEAIVPYMALLGLLVGANVTLIYALVSRVAASVGEVSMGSAMLTVFLSAGQLLGPPASGALVAGGSWASATVATVGGSILMAVCAIALIAKTSVRKTS